MKSFENWKYEEVENAFGIESVRDADFLMDWLDVNKEVSKYDENELVKLKLLLQEEVVNWNEDELKLFFIGSLLNLVNFKSQYYKPFTQRKLTAKIDNIQVGGIVEFVVARGKQDPHEPFLFVHEYKQENKRESDPLGQLLIAMVAAQQKNETPHPILGAYVTGRFWFFVQLVGNKYAVSLAYDATREDIFLIFNILQKAKTIINQYLPATKK